MEEINPNPCTRSSSCMLETKTRPKEQLNCPRCQSSNTKFCYYNNYNLTQPRYFCKSCRRYWTEGGSLRNVPVGGGSRKNKKSAMSSASASSSSSSSSTDHLHTHNSLKLPNYHFSQFSTPNPAGRDLNLAFPAAMSHYAEVPKVENVNCEQQKSAMELVRSSGTGSFRGLSSFEPNPNPNLGINNPFPSGFSLSVDGYGGLPFEQLNQQHSAAPNESDHHHQNERQESISTGLIWSGMLGGGSL